MAAELAADAAGAIGKRERHRGGAWFLLSRETAAARPEVWRSRLKLGETLWAARSPGISLCLSYRSGARCGKIKIGEVGESDLISFHPDLSPVAQAVRGARHAGKGARSRLRIISLRNRLLAPFSPRWSRNVVAEPVHPTIRWTFG